jgi:uncharacterized protein YbaR (Trm112 family)/ubiquinone/menaquinone biosynthesis C-methylase UbiE
VDVVDIVKVRLLEMIVCSKCAGELSAAGEASGAEIEEGKLVCRSCGSEYPIVGGIPFFNPEALEESITARAFSDQWQLRQKGVFERQDVFGFTEAEYVTHFCYAFGVKDYCQLRDVIVEAGIGSGCLAIALARAAPETTIMGLDISSSLRSLATVARQLPNLHLIQCDLVRPPVKKGIADKVYASGVLHHLEKPVDGLASLWSLVKKGGQLYFWVYPSYQFCAYDRLRRILGAPFRWPGRIRYVLAWMLAPIMWIYFAVSRRYSYKKSLENMRTVAFRIFDNLSPEFQHRVSKEEVAGWCGRTDIRSFRIIEDLGVVCDRQ